MEFGWSDAHADYRKNVQTFLQRELPSNWREDYAKGVGSVTQIDFSREFCAKLAEEDLLLPHWPMEYGGRNGEQLEQFILMLAPLGCLIFAFGLKPLRRAYALARAQEADLSASPRPLPQPELMT